MGWLELLDEVDRKGRAFLWTMVSGMATFLLVAYCWIAIAQRKPSLIAGRIYRSSALDLWITFLAVVLAVELVFLFSILRQSQVALPGGQHQTRRGHKHRVAVGEFWCWTAAAFEILVFRVLYAIYEINFASGIAPKVTILVVTEDIALGGLAIGLLCWVKRFCVFKIAKHLDVSLAPVVDHDSSGSLVLADGSRMTRGSMGSWPKNGIGRARIAFVIRDSGYEFDIAVTEDGDSYPLP